MMLFFCTQMGVSKLAPSWGCLRLAPTRDFCRLAHKIGAQMRKPQIGFHMGYPRFATRWVSPKLASNGSKMAWPGWGHSD